MKSFAPVAMNFFRSQDGTSTVEYGLLVGLLSLVAVVAIMGVRDLIAESFGRTLFEFSKGGISAE